MLVDVVLVAGDQYWRARQAWPTVPTPGAVVQVLDDVHATLVGSTDVENATEGSAAVSVLLRARAGSRGGLGSELRRAGWHRLL